MTSELEQRPISIDGASFVVAGGEWEFVGCASSSALRWSYAAPRGFTSVDGALLRNDQAVGEKPLIAWRSLDAEGNFAGLVQARNALEALQQLPEGHSVYLGGP